MFYLIGLGLGSEKDITLHGLEIIKKCDKVYLEGYTSILTCGKEKLEEFYGREIFLADREVVEQEFDDIIREGKTKEIALLVVGDPFGATTHIDLMVRARDNDVPVSIVHNASILNAVGCSGLSLYRMGQTISIVFFTDTWRPDSFYEKIVYNKNSGLHTLCLLDIQVKERSVENILRDRKIYNLPRFMTVDVAASQLLEIEGIRKEGACTESTMCVGLARIGCEDQKISFGTLKQMSEADLGGPLHSLIVCGDLHEMELEFVKQFAIVKEHLHSKLKE